MLYKAFTYYFLSILNIFGNQGLHYPNNLTYTLNCTVANFGINHLNSVNSIYSQVLYGFGCGRGSDSSQSHNYGE